MSQKEMVAMLLAGGQGSRLGVLTTNKAKPAVSFGGKYRIIDFPMSNCINSGVDTVGVLTQYQPLSLNKHIGIGIPWDLDRQNGGVSILAPYHKGNSGEWYMGTANAIYQNINYIDSFDPKYVLILSGDHIYKMDYSLMLEFHKKNNCDATIAVLEVPINEANRFGIMNTRSDDSIYEFEEKPENPKNNLASMGIYIFTWSNLKKALIEDKDLHPDSDFGKHIIPLMLKNNSVMYAYRFHDYWKDVGTIDSYWAANMELIKTLPEFNLYDEFWKIYTDSIYQPPQFASLEATIKTSLISQGCSIYGNVFNSIIGNDVIIGHGCEVRDSIIMSSCIIGDNTIIDKCIIDENTMIGSGVNLGFGENIPNFKNPNVYNTGITVIGDDTNIPDNISIGKNCAIHGFTKQSHYKDNNLESGETLIVDSEVTI